MANLPETSGATYPELLQHENGDAQSGGPWDPIYRTGNWNAHGAALVERTNYLKVQITNLTATLTQNYVPNTRTITGTDGLTGGGSLTADRTLSADFATQAEAEAGTAAAKVMSPARVADYAVKHVLFKDLAQTITQTMFGGLHLLVNGNVSEANQPFGVTIEAWDPGLMFIDRTSTGGSGLIRYNAQEFQIYIDTENDGQVGTVGNLSHILALTVSASTLKFGTNNIWHAGNDAPIKVPVGAVSAFAGATPPTNWLECNGAAISRTSYAALFAVIGTTYGAGNGSTTFNLPDLRGEFVRGWDNGRGVDIGRTRGSAQAASRIHVPDVGSRQDTTQYDISINRYRIGNIYTPQANLEDITILDYNLNAGTYYYTQVLTETAPTDDQSIHGAIRPRNVSMMYCIKY